jgi:PAS domain S-box-containing protein
MLESADGLRTLLDSIDELVLVHDADGGILDCNRAACRHLGYPRERLLRLRMRDLEPTTSPGDDQDGVVRPPSGRCGSYETVHLAKDGRHIPVEVNATSLEYAGRQITLIVGRDITERRRVAEALRVSEERYRTLYTRTPVMLHSIDRSGRLVAVSDTWLETLGYQRAEVLGRKSLEFLTSESQHLAQEVVLPAFFATGACRDVPYQMLTRDGRVLDVLLSATAERDAQGQVVRSLAVMIDVTARKSAEKEKERLEARLRRAQKMEAIGQLAGGLAHDFNNILTAILGNVELLRSHLGNRCELDEMGRAHLEQIERAALRAAALTRQMLAFGRPQPVRRERLDLNTILADMEKMLRRLIPESVALGIVRAPQLGHIHGDPGQIEQVVMNLVVNARDAMLDGGQLTLETAHTQVDEAHRARHPEARLGPHVVLTVRDTGCGMSPEILAQIFEPFFTTKPVGQGTGLGLATVDAIVRQLNGHITVTSAVQHGTTFCLYFPQAATEAAPQEPGPSQRPTPRGTETVLVCEDDEMVRRLATEFLRAAGYSVLSAANGRQGLELATTHAGPIDLLVTDVVMPDLNGPQLAETLRAARPRIKTLYVSVYAPVNIGPQGVSEPGVELLEKPFGRQGMLARVREVLDCKSKPHPTPVADISKQ